MVGEHHLLVRRNRRQDGQTQALRQWGGKRDGAARLFVLVGVELNGVIGAQRERLILRVRIGGRRPHHLHVF